MANADPRLLQLHGADNVLVARQATGAGATIWVTGQRICLAAPLPIGHKLARHAIAPGASALRYGCPTGLRPRRSPPPIAPADRPRRSPGASTFTCTLSAAATHAVSRSNRQDEHARVQAGLPHRHPQRGGRRLPRAQSGQNGSAWALGFEVWRALLPHRRSSLVGKCSSRMRPSRRA